MARSIQVLPDAVANQIAAGEVVERPASVVKELVENALDAGARRVEIRLEGGGKKSIVVSDDGTGMGREDALLSLDRHATSKIRGADELRGVRSFGFRGEALPSIAAVSRMTLDTRDASAEAGTRIRAAGGRIDGVEDVARSQGTTVSVEQLFFNARARAEFLKAAGAETRAVVDSVTTLALAHPGTAFHLTSGDRVLLDLPATRELGRRIADLWGEEEASTLIPLTAEGEEIRVQGLIQRPDAATPGFRRSHLFVDGRPFKDSALVRAVDRGYETTVAEAVRPWHFLYLQAEPGSVDVNVHPTKQEVRFRDATAVRALLEESVRSLLSGNESAATLDSVPKAPSLTVREGRGRRDPADPATERDKGQMALFVPSAAPDEGGAAGSPPGTGSVGAEPGGEGAAGEFGADPGRPRMPRLFQVHRTWIVAETRDGILLVDQHSAHERILYQELVDAFASSAAESQRLLFPITLRLSEAEYERVMELQGLFHRAGFEVEGFGGTSIIVHAVPDPHPYFDAERCFREMIEELTEGSELVRSAHTQHDRIAKTFACKGAIKAGQALGQDEMVELIDRLFATELPHHDVHGRPTIVRLSRAELERKFGR